MTGCFIMKYILFLTTPLLLLATSSFITPIEYASQLYKNPRGIGCHHCHGENGEGKLIANYMHKKERKSFSGPAINKMSFAAFHKALDDRKRGMPRYFLTKKEVAALYLHLQENNKQKKSNAK